MKRRGLAVPEQKGDFLDCPLQVLRISFGHLVAKVSEHSNQCCVFFGKSALQRALAHLQLRCHALRRWLTVGQIFSHPGVAGSPRWGIPESAPLAPRVRRSWSKLNDTERKRVVDAFIALKHITPASGHPGSLRADYTSFCDELGLGGYERNLYDFYVEAHVSVRRNEDTVADDDADAA
jgi:hypothetical protein